MIFFQAHYLRQFPSYFGVRILSPLAEHVNIYISNACLLAAIPWGFVLEREREKAELVSLIKKYKPAFKSIDFLK